MHKHPVIEYEMEIFERKNKRLIVWINNWILNNCMKLSNELNIKMKSLNENKHWIQINKNLILLHIGRNIQAGRVLLTWKETLNQKSNANI